MSDSEYGSSSSHVIETPPRKKRKRSRHDDVTTGTHLQLTWEEDPYEHLHRSMKEFGGEWKSGRWTKAEKELLLSNISRYCKENDISNVTEFIQEEQCKEKSDFYASAAWGIKRPLFLIYRQIWRLFPPAAKGGKFTEEEVKQLKKLHEQHGNQWVDIGHQMDRTNQSVRDKVRILGFESAGAWSNEELELLVSAVKECKGGINWEIVARKVKTRNAKHCYKKWLHCMCWKELDARVNWSKQDDIRLVRELSQSSATDEEEVNWKKMAESDWPSARSASYLRCRWAALRRQVANYELHSFRSDQKIHQFYSHVLHSHSS
ncbi:cyclin-D-binding Myb-like transcription factor 1 isoform X2 [Dysidea avara]|uniref:cyclin-D-binding Myb-like transcription factor 1 isoform X2 n=1 Tax=Dysidea avara TaxID=196820 RepID=UPI003326B7D0